MNHPPNKHSRRKNEPYTHTHTDLLALSLSPPHQIHSSLSISILIRIPTFLLPPSRFLVLLLITALLSPTMTTNEKPTVLIVGAGLGGLLLGALLEKSGVPYTIFERAATVKPLGICITCLSSNQCISCGCFC